MTALKSILRHGSTRRPARSDERRRAFTLTELIVVIAIIVLLVGLLLAALGQARKKSKETATAATMRAFANACETFHQEHDFYPGVVPEAILANDPKMTGTQNALLHLMGGYAREDDGADIYDNASGVEFQFQRPGGGVYKIKVDRSRIGDGPVIGTKPYAPYFTPTSDVGVVDGALGGGAPANLHKEVPTLLDSWGQPILYFRRLRSVGPLTAMAGPMGNPKPPQFVLETGQTYMESPALGKLGRNQGVLSMFQTSQNPNALFAKLIEHPSLRGQSRGAFMLMSAGDDGVYMSREDGAGSPGEPEDEIVQVDGDGNVTFLEGFSATTLEEYDDIIEFGGS
jgi:prepilin-type N-terminal cleavage/methylation domain-containing protein